MINLTAPLRKVYRTIRQQDQIEHMQRLITENTKAKTNLKLYLCLIEQDMANAERQAGYYGI